jgi:hypothetical protein
MNRAARPPPVRLFSAEAILAHTLLMTPLCGSILAAINHRRLGNRVASRRTLALFAVPSALILGAQAVVSERLSPFLHLGGFLWTLWLARRLFREHQPIFAQHLASGGQTARWYFATLTVVGFILLGLLAVFGSELL